MKSFWEEVTIIFSLSKYCMLKIKKIGWFLNILSYSSFHLIHFHVGVLTLERSQNISFHYSLIKNKLKDPMYIINNFLYTVCSIYCDIHSKIFRCMCNILFCMLNILWCNFFNILIQVWKSCVVYWKIL